MTKEAIITAIIVQILIAGFTCYFFYKVLTSGPKPGVEDTKGEASDN